MKRPKMNCPKLSLPLNYFNMLQHQPPLSQEKLEFHLWPGELMLWRGGEEAFFLFYVNSSQMNVVESDGPLAH